MGYVHPTADFALREGCLVWFGLGFSLLEFELGKKDSLPRARLGSLHPLTCVLW